VIGHLVGLNQVAAPNFNHIESKTTSRNIDYPLANKIGFEATWCTIGSSGGLVCDHLQGFTAIRRPVIRTRQERSTHSRNSHPVGSDICARIVKHTIL